MSDQPPARRRLGRPPKYPMDLWLDGQDKLLTRRDVMLERRIPDNSQIRNVRAAILATAQRRGIVVNTELTTWDGPHRMDESIGLRFARAEGAPEPYVAGMSVPSEENAEPVAAPEALPPEQEAELAALWADAPAVEVPEPPRGLVVRTRGVVDGE